jgi:hypothetical protein
MQATAWSNGATGYGLEIRASDRDRFFDRNWRNVVLELSGQGPAVVAVSPSFWRRCSELRSAEIGRWLQLNGLAPWPRGRRPKVIMEQISGNRFVVKLPG